MVLVGASQELSMLTECLFCHCNCFYAGGWQMSFSTFGFLLNMPTCFPGLQIHWNLHWTRRTLVEASAKQHALYKTGTKLIKAIKGVLDWFGRKLYSGVLCGKPAWSNYQRSGAMQGQNWPQKCKTWLGYKEFVGQPQDGKELKHGESNIILTCTIFSSQWKFVSKILVKRTFLAQQN